MPDTTLEESNYDPTTSVPEHSRTDTEEAGKMLETSPMTEADRGKLGAEATQQVVPSPRLHGSQTASRPDALDGLASPWPLPPTNGSASRV